MWYFMIKKVVLKLILMFLVISSTGIIVLRTSKASSALSLIDQEIPTLNVKELNVHTSDSNYNVYDNITYSFGMVGGNVDCISNIKVGDNTVTCNAIGNNGLGVTKSFNVNLSNTYDKSIIFFGDSITYGYGSKNSEYSFVDYIDNHYDFKDVVNAAHNDFRVSTYQRPQKWLGLEVLDHASDSDYDYVIMQGGVNDALWNTPIGELTTTYDNVFDTNTFYGGLETYILSVINKWPNAKIGYIITYYTPNYSEKGTIYSFEHYKLYYDALKKTLLKYNIPYLDLFEGYVGIDSYSSILEVDTNKYLNDNLHLNDEGYNQIAPTIYSWISNLEKYERITTKK